MIIYTSTPDEQQAVILMTDRLRVKIGRHSTRHINMPGTVFAENGMRLHEAVQDLAKEGCVLAGLTLTFKHEVRK
jgi:hypothetical protein